MQNWSTEKKNLNEVGEALNEANLLSTISWCVKTINAQRLRIEALEAKERGATVKAPPTKITRYEPVILESMSNGKAWNVYSLMEDIHERYPQFPEPNKGSLTSTLCTMTDRGLIIRIGGGTYRIASK